MKIALIGSTRYKNNKMANAKANLIRVGHQVGLPTFDGGAPNELALMDSNLALIKWADKVIVFWDGESKGTYGDICMAFALDKPVSIGFLNPILFRNILIQLADRDASRN
jgi:nucleoside 2-deoxyribosyltransferase